MRALTPAVGKIPASTNPFCIIRCCFVLLCEDDEHDQCVRENIRWVNWVYGNILQWLDTVGNPVPSASPGRGGMDRKGPFCLYVQSKNYMEKNIITKQKLIKRAGECAVIPCLTLFSRSLVDSLSTCAGILRFLFKVPVLFPPDFSSVSFWQ